MILVAASNTFFANSSADLRSSLSSSKVPSSYLRTVAYSVSSFKPGRLEKASSFIGSS
jgi:hypothetical protein